MCYTRDGSKSLICSLNVFTKNELPVHSYSIVIEHSQFLLVLVHWKLKIFLKIVSVVSYNTSISPLRTPSSSSPLSSRSRLTNIAIRPFEVTVRMWSLPNVLAENPGEICIPTRHPLCIWTQKIRSLAHKCAKHKWRIRSPSEDYGYTCSLMGFFL